VDHTRAVIVSADDKQRDTHLLCMERYGGRFVAALLAGPNPKTPPPYPSGFVLHIAAGRNGVARCEGPHRIAHHMLFQRDVMMALHREVMRWNFNTVSVGSS
jgi:hypothetical protein